MIELGIILGLFGIAVLLLIPNADQRDKIQMFENLQNAIDRDARQQIYQIVQEWPQFAALTTEEKLQFLDDAVQITRR